MATVIWRGGAAKVAQVTAYLFAGTWEATDVVNIVIGNKALAVIAGSTTITTIIDTVVTAFNALAAVDYPEFTGEITASRSSNSLVLTANEGGKPFTATVSTTETGGGAPDAQTIDGAASSQGTNTIGPTGPSHWDSAANWSGGAIPADTDDVILQDSASDILYGLAQSSVDLASLTIKASFTGRIGLPDLSTGGYSEHRTKELTLGTATVVTVGEGEGQGSGFIRLNTGSNATAITVWKTGSALETAQPAFQWRGAHNSNTLSVYGEATVGVALGAGQTATLSALRVEDGGDVECGSGVTFSTATITNAGGAVEVNSAFATLNQTDGTTTVRGAGAITTVNLDGGEFLHLGTGTVTTLNIGEDAGASFDGTATAITVTNCTVSPGWRFLRDPNKRVTWTNGVKFNRTGVQTDQIDLGEHYTLTPSAY